MLVSVIIPVYNVEYYVKEAIQSIKNQTYKNLEIIIIDDNSSDKTYTIVEELARNDERIKLYKNEKNLKIAKTLNRALSLSNGEYIARMDGDDISALDRIEKKVKFLEENKEFDLVGCSMKAIDTNGKQIDQTVHYSNQNLLIKSLKYATPVSHIWIARKSLYEELNGYREISGVEDYDFLLRMTSSNFKYTNLEDYFGYFVRLGRSGNTISNFGIRQRKMHSYVFKLYEERLKNQKDSFSEEDLKEYTKTSGILETVHSFSSKMLYKAIEAKGEQKYLKTIIYLLASLVSPYQINYLIDRLKYRIIIRKYKK
ncbi:MAG: glycosyltransferase family 2 protein [Campylobacterales bacterium]|nr:glycosyltransferase family 2 protein [Campylobacterales bacterium]